jgi:hypothetical protein
MMETALAEKASPIAAQDARGINDAFANRASLQKIQKAAPPPKSLIQRNKKEEKHHDKEKRSKMQKLQENEKQMYLLGLK